MATFHYIARNNEGTEVKGSVQAQSRLEASDQVRSQGLWLLELQAEAAPVNPMSQAQTHVLKPLFGGVPLDALTNFFRQLATMLGAGVPIHQAMHTLGNQRANPRLRKVITEIRESIVAGENIADAFDRYPEIFNPVQRALIRVGVTGGLLENNLRQIADYLEQEQELRRLLRKTTLYPKVLVFAAIVIPQVPPLVLGALGVQGGKPANEVVWGIVWVFAQIGLLIFGLWAAGRILTQNRAFRWTWDAFKVSIPSVGFTLRQLALAKFARALSALYNSGLPFTQAVRVAADASGNEYLSSAIKPTALKIESGLGITESLQSAKVFPQMVMDMVATGENTGEVGTMLDKVGDYYEEEGKVRAQQAAVIFGVVVYLGIAIYIAFLVIQSYSGYFAGVMNSAGE